MKAWSSSSSIPRARCCWRWKGSLTKTPDAGTSQGVLPALTSRSRHFRTGESGHFEGKAKSAFRGDGSIIVCPERLTRVTLDIERTGRQKDSRSVTRETHPGESNKRSNFDVAVLMFLCRQASCSCCYRRMRDVSCLLACSTLHNLFWDVFSSLKTLYRKTNTIAGTRVLLRIEHASREVAGKVSESSNL